MDHEQTFHDNKADALARARQLAKQGKHGAVIYTRDSEMGNVYCVESPCGMIRTWEKEIMTF